MYLARFDADQMSLTLGTTGAYGQFIPTWEFPRVFVDEGDATRSLLTLGYTPQPWTEGPGPFGVFMELAELDLPPRFVTPAVTQEELDDLPPRFFTVTKTA